MAADATVGDRRPIPDPTILTTQQLNREIGALREIIETRLDGMDKAIELLQTLNNHAQDFVKTEVSHLQTLHDEKFKSIQNQFIERDTRTEQTSRDSKVAVDAALQAAKEAVGEQNKSSALAIAKSEAATNKQLDGIGTLLNTTAGGLTDKIDDLRTRLTTIEGRSSGGKDVYGYMIAAGGLVIAALVFFIK